VSDSTPDDLFGTAGDEGSGFAQEGPDLFGTEPDELIVTHEPEQLATLDIDVDEDTYDEIPIDPDDENAEVPGSGDLVVAEPPEAGSDAEASSERVASADLPVPMDAEGPPAASAPATGERTPTASGPTLPPAPPQAHVTRPEAPLALYRRYRPDTFADVIGQDHVTEPLRRALVNNRVNHAYLFSGPRGCGKTTSARILARCLNCEQGPTPEPCGQCQSCRDLARGGPGSIDVIEIDAASHGGVNEARDLRERAFFAPVHSRYKIYIIDEAHMVTKEGFNALLKLVEEPPPHVKFIFATTEPEKVLGTIRSRTHHYPFRLVPPRLLASYLESLCEQEGVTVDKAVLPLVVRAGAGSVRDSLSVLDQLLGGASEGGVSYRQATALLGYTPDTLLDEIMDAFAAGDSAGVFACVDRVIEVGQDPRRFAEDLLRRLRDLIIVAAVPDALTTGLVDVAGDQAERLTTQASGMGAGELTRAAEVIAKGLTDMRGTTAPRLHLELMCARVLLPGADVDARGIHARLDRLERRLSMVGEPGEQAGVQAGARPSASGGAGAPGGPTSGPAASSIATATGSGAAAPERSGRQGAPKGDEQSGGGWASDWTPGDPPGRAGYDRDRGAPQPGEVSGRAAAQDGPTAPTASGPADSAGQQAAAAGRGDTGSLSTADVRRMWPQVLEAVKGRRRVTWIVLSQNAQVHDFTNGVLTLALSSAGAKESFGRGGSPDILRESLIEVLGIAPTIEAIVAGGGPEPPAPGSTPGGRPPGSQGDGRGGPQGGSQGGPSGGGQGGPRNGAGRSRQADASAGRAPSADSPYGAENSPGGDPAGGQAGMRGGPAATRSKRPSAAGPVGRDEPPEWEPEDPADDYERPNFAALARENIRKTQLSPPSPQSAAEPVEQGRDDADLDSSDIDVEELLTKELGAQLIAEEPETP